MYQFMRLMGYPAASISILTTYNGQKALLRDVIERRCAGHPMFGRPKAVSGNIWDACSSLVPACHTTSHSAESFAFHGMLAATKHQHANNIS